MMPFTSTTAALKHNSGMDKADIEQGFERLDSTADQRAYAYNMRNPEWNGWRNPPPAEMVPSEGVDYTD